MTEKQLKKFKEAIYNPYTEAWTVMKSLRDSDLSKQSTWDEYMKKCELFKAKYNTEIGGSIYRVMLDAGDETKRVFYEL